MVFCYDNLSWLRQQVSAVSRPGISLQANVTPSLFPPYSDPPVTTASFCSSSETHSLYFRALFNKCCSLSSLLCSRQNNGFQRCLCNQWICYFTWQKDIANVIKDPEREDDFEFSGWDQCNHKGLIRQRQEVQHQREGEMTTQQNSEWCHCWQRAVSRGMFWSLGYRKGNPFLKQILP